MLEDRDPGASLDVVDILVERNPQTNNKPNSAADALDRNADSYWILYDIAEVYLLRSSGIRKRQSLGLPPRPRARS